MEVVGRRSEVSGAELQESGEPCLSPQGPGRREGRLFWKQGDPSSQAGGQVRKKDA